MNTLFTVLPQPAPEYSSTDRNIDLVTRQNAYNPHSPICGHMQGNTFVCDQTNQQIEGCKSGFRAWLQRIFQKNTVLLRVSINGHRRRIYVPVKTAREIIGETAPEKDGIGQLFANTIHKAQALVEYEKELRENASAQPPCAYGEDQAFIDLYNARQAQLQEQRLDENLVVFKKNLVDSPFIGGYEKEEAQYPDFVEARVQGLIAAATKGHCGAQLELARRYAEGKNGVSQNHEEAQRLRQEAHSQTSGESLYTLAMAYKQGLFGLDENLSTFLQFLQASVEKSYAPALHTLGEAYFYGWYGLTQDLNKATELLQAACDQSRKNGPKHLLWDYERVLKLVQDRLK